MSRPELLFLTEENPFPMNGGGKIRDGSMLRLLAEKATVEVLCFGARASRTTVDGGVVVTELRRGSNPLWRRALSPFRPYVVNGFSDAVLEALRTRAAAGKILWLSRLAMARYAASAKKLGYRVILDEHNVESELLIALARKSLKGVYDRWLAAKCAQVEARFCRQVSAVVVTSERDLEALRKMAPETRYHLVPNCIDANSYEELRSHVGSTLFFQGTLDYFPNHEGLDWFMREVLAAIKSELGAAMPRIVVAGANPSAALVSALTAHGIEVCANPPSMLPLLRDSAVEFVPLRSGSGTRIKILEAMAAGRAVVSTAKGAEGLRILSGRDCIIADEPREFAAKVSQLFKDSELRLHVGKEAARTIDEVYDWRCSRAAIETLLGGASARSL